MSELKTTQKETECSVDGCKRMCRCKRLCLRHYRQMNRRGYIYGNPKKLKYGEANRCSIDGDICRIELYDINGNVKAVATIDVEDYPKVKNIKWSMDHYGYVVYSRRNKKSIKLHQVILGRVNIDHKNGNLLDNTKANLRECTHQENSFNCQLSKNNSSGYKGVVWDKNRRKWISQIKHNYKSIHLGRYEKKTDAAIAYNNAAIKLFGQFAKLNQVHPNTRIRSHTSWKS